MMNEKSVPQSVLQLEAARSILRVLQNAGYEAYFVGGYVRDLLLGRATQDIDIATSAIPDEVIRLFPHTVATGLQHGTVSVIIDKIAYEVTTFRSESDYEQARRPKQVTFIRELRADLERRDFTMNAIALDIDGNILDPFAGQADLKARFIRAVGIAKDRFAEDALRMLRCLRFAANLDFSIDPDTWQGLLDQRSRLVEISIERVRMELDKMVEGNHPERAIKLLIESGLYRFFKTARAFSDALSRRTQMTGASGSQHAATAIPFDLQHVTSAEARWSFLFLCLAIEADHARQICRELTHSNKKTDEITNIIRMVTDLKHQIESRRDDSVHDIWRATVVRYNEQLSSRVIQVVKNLNAVEPGWSMLAQHADRWLAEMKVTSLRQLEVNGNDIMKFLGKKNGPWLKHLLFLMLQAVAVGRLENKREALLAFARRIESGEHTE